MSIKKAIKTELPDVYPLESLASRLTIIWAGESNSRMSVDAKSEFSENESSTSSSSTTPPIIPITGGHQNALNVVICKQDTRSVEQQQQDAAWQNYTSMMPFWTTATTTAPQPLKDKMLQPPFDPQLYSRWNQMGDASGFYGHPDLYSSFGIPSMPTAAPPALIGSTSSQLAPNASLDSDVKPPLSNGSSSHSDSTGSMYPSPSDMFLPSTSSAGVGVSVATSSAVSSYQQQMAAAATCYQQGWPFLDYQQHLPWKMSLATKDHRRSLSNGSTHLKLPTGPGTNNIRVRTADKYRMVYSDHQRLELEKEFHMSPFINSDRKSYLSTELSLTERQIKIWFQNRRAKDRRDKQKTPRIM